MTWIIVHIILYLACILWINIAINDLYKKGYRYSITDRVKVSIVAPIACIAFIIIEIVTWYKA